MLASLVCVTLTQLFHVCSATTGCANGAAWRNSTDRFVAVYYLILLFLRSTTVRYWRCWAFQFCSLADATTVFITRCRMVWAVR